MSRVGSLEIETATHSRKFAEKEKVFRDINDNIVNLINK